MSENAAKRNTNAGYCFLRVREELSARLEAAMQDLERRIAKAGRMPNGLAANRRGHVSTGQFVEFLLFRYQNEQARQEAAVKKRKPRGRKSA